MWHLVLVYIDWDAKLSDKFSFQSKFFRTSIAYKEGLDMSIQSFWRFASKNGYCTLQFSPGNLQPIKQSFFFWVGWGDKFSNLWLRSIIPTNTIIWHCLTQKRKFTKTEQTSGYQNLYLIIWHLPKAYS